MPLMSSFLETSCEDHDSYEVFSSLAYASGNFLQVIFTYGEYWNPLLREE